MSTQPTLPGVDSLPKTFDGVTYTPKHDQKRLTGQLKAVYKILSTGPWYTLQDIRTLVFTYSKGKMIASEASVSARLRDLRKEKFGGHTVNKRHRGDPKRGLWEYQLERRGK
ncbi:hypothetical protein LCGC14_1209780 [marine sediment metagenome]|uniref:Uncharacterized protein n=1 Tax=marine sediment metagenome TaxID=412755 RepID=A0A0F9LIQ1_9ZZZZ